MDMDTLLDAIRKGIDMDLLSLSLDNDYDDDHELSDDEIIEIGLDTILNVVNNDLIFEEMSDEIVEEGVTGGNIFLENSSVTMVVKHTVDFDDDEYDKDIYIQQGYISVLDFDKFLDMINGIITLLNEKLENEDSDEQLEMIDL